MFFNTIQIQVLFIHLRHPDLWTGVTLCQITPLKRFMYNIVETCSCTPDFKNNNKGEEEVIFFLEEHHKSVNGNCV